MFRGQKVIVVMPAYNAAKTLCRTHAEVMAQEYVDQVIVVDDGSDDETLAIARTLPQTLVHAHLRNQGSFQPAVRVAAMRRDQPQPQASGRSSG